MQSTDILSWNLQNNALLRHARLYILEIIVTVTKVWSGVNILLRYLVDLTQPPNFKIVPLRELEIDNIIDTKSRVNNG